MDPDNPERGLGQPVWDAPPPGTVRKPVGITTKTVRREGTKTVVRATYTLALAGITTMTTEDTAITTYLVCEQQSDGTWRVTGDPGPRALTRERPPGHMELAARQGNSRPSSARRQERVRS
ncbi:hypothetical protein [Streptomyces chilikensis]|uniref:hypothetical protein n=1 Tax=Streptomyces chilikensis TaxID=1194079 RepID=UPI001409E62F|nr:hypothetical protein [Streptomyces chilikensis]